MWTKAHDALRVEALEQPGLALIWACGGGQSRLGAFKVNNSWAVARIECHVWVGTCDALSALSLRRESHAGVDDCARECALAHLGDDELQRAEILIDQPQRTGLVCGRVDIDACGSPPGRALGAVVEKIDAPGVCLAPSEAQVAAIGIVVRDRRPPLR